MKQQRPRWTLREWYIAMPRFASGKRSMVRCFSTSVLYNETARLRELCVLRDARGRGDADIIMYTYVANNG